MNTVATYTHLDAAERQRQSTLRTLGLQKIEPVWVPGGIHDLPPHLGWPVAVMAGEVILVTFSSDAGKERSAFEGRPDCVTRSTDSGETWSKPVRLWDQVLHPEAHGPGMRAIGVTEAGHVLISTSRGLFQSKDQGQTWTHLQSRGLPPPQWGNVGPRILAHPEHGLVIAAHAFGVKRAGDGADECFHLFVSGDEGLSWKEIRVATPGPFGPSEPTAFLHEGKLAIFSRNHAGPSTGREGYWWTWSYFAQFFPEPAPATLPLAEQSWTGRLTNIYNRRMDTPDACFNPVSRRIEAIIPKRNEGFPYPDNGHQTLSLWSMDPEGFFSGAARWRFDGVLLRSKGTQGRSRDPDFPPREGLHPAGTVIDEKRNLQHIFFFAGDRTHRGPDSGQTGLFRLSRTLDTDQLRGQLRELDPDGAPAYRVEESFATLEAWTPNGGPLGLRISPDDRDVVRRTLAPLPDGEVSTDGEGLRIRTKAAGHYGLYHEEAVVFDDTTLTVQARVLRYPQEGDALGIVMNRGSQRLHLVLRRDGIYHRTDGEGPLKLLLSMDMDHDWHEWTLTIDHGMVTISRDGEELTRTGVWIDDHLGQEDAPIGIYVRSTATDDPVEVQVASLTLHPATRDKCG